MIRNDVLIIHAFQFCGLSLSFVASSYPLKKIEYHLLMIRWLYAAMLGISDDDDEELDDYSGRVFDSIFLGGKI